MHTSLPSTGGFWQHRKGGAPYHLIAWVQPGPLNEKTIPMAFLDAQGHLTSEWNARLGVFVQGTIGEQDVAALYRAQDGRLWLREAQEFLTRFTVIDPLVGAATFGPDGIARIADHLAQPPPAPQTLAEFFARYWDYSRAGHDIQASWKRLTLQLTGVSTLPSVPATLVPVQRRDRPRREQDIRSAQALLLAAAQGAQLRSDYLAQLPPERRARHAAESPALPAGALSSVNVTARQSGLKLSFNGEGFQLHQHAPTDHWQPLETLWNDIEALGAPEPTSAQP